MVTTFLFSLCNEDTLAELLNDVDTEDLISLEELGGCKQKLQDFALEKLREVQCCVRVYVMKISQFLEWIFEMQDENFIARAAASLKDEIWFRSESNLHLDTLRFNHFLQIRKTYLSLHLSIGRNDDYRYLVEEFGKTITKKSNIQV